MSNYSQLGFCMSTMVQLAVLKLYWMQNKESFTGIFVGILSNISEWLVYEAPMTSWFPE